MSDDNENVGGDDLSFTAEEQAQFAAIRSEAPSEPVEERSEAAEADAPETAEAADWAPKGQERAKDPLHQAMHEEREKRKGLQRQIEQERIERARLEERTNLILRQLQGYGPQPQQQPEPPKVPDPEEDVFGAVKHLLQKQQATEAQIEAYKQQELQRRQQAQHFEGLTGALRHHESRAREQVSDYDDAMKYFADVRAADLRAQGYTDNRAINQEITRQDLQHIDYALRNRADPAALAYQRAIALGYKKAAPAPAVEQPRAPDGKFAPSDLSRVAAGQAASKTLAGGGAREGGVVIDAKALASMSESEFEEFRTKNPKAYDRLMGRDAA
jgi:hypothetical protein